MIINLCCNLAKCTKVAVERCDLLRDENMGLLVLAGGQKKKDLVSVGFGLAIPGVMHVGKGIPRCSERSSTENDNFHLFQRRYSLSQRRHNKSGNDCISIATHILPQIPLKKVAEKPNLKHKSNCHSRLDELPRRGIASSAPATTSRAPSPANNGRFTEQLPR